MEEYQKCGLRILTAIGVKRQQLRLSLGNRGCTLIRLPLTTCTTNLTRNGTQEKVEISVCWRATNATNDEGETLTSPHYPLGIGY